MLAGGAAWGLSRIRLNSINVQAKIETFLKAILLTCSVVAVFTTIGIVLSVLFESLRFFQLVSPLEFFFGTTWSPQVAIRPDQVGSSGAFGSVPLFAGTLLITAIVMLVSVPIGLMTALYLSELAHPRTRAIVKPLLEILAGIPTVVYGFFAALAVAPVIRDLGSSLGLPTSSESALAAGLAMGIMIIPFISSLSDDVINAVPQSLRDGSYALGATHAETIMKVIFSGCIARNCRQYSAGDFTRDRRDDDRGHGSGARGESDRQSARIRYYRNSADRDFAQRRSGIRQPENISCLCAWADIVFCHAGTQCHRAESGQEIS